MLTQPPTELELGLSLAILNILTCDGNIGEYMTNDKPSEFTCIYANEHMSNCHAVDVCLLKANLVNLQHIQKLKQFSDFTPFSVHSLQCSFIN